MWRIFKLKFTQKFGWYFPQILRPKNSKILVWFWTTLRLYRKYLRNTTTHCQSENDVANYGRCHTGKLNYVYVGPETVKNRTGVLTNSTGGHLAGHCHASSTVIYYYPMRQCRMLKISSLEDRHCEQYVVLIGKLAGIQHLGSIPKLKRECLQNSRC